jgi:hypothetical protein
VHLVGFYLVLWLMMHGTMNVKANNSFTLGLWKESEDNCEIPFRKNPFAQIQLNCSNLNERCLLSSFIVVATNRNKKQFSPAGWCGDMQSETISSSHWKPSRVHRCGAVDGSVIILLLRLAARKRLTIFECGTGQSL